VARRVPDSCLILVPRVNARVQEQAHLGRAACRTAWLDGLQPIFPLFMYGGFFSEEEQGRGLEEAVVWWSRRSQCIWLCSDVELGGIPELGLLAHRVLRINEGVKEGSGWLLGRKRHYSDRGRAPVSLFLLEAGTCEPLPRDRLDDILKCNIATGLIGGTS